MGALDETNIRLYWRRGTPLEPEEVAPGGVGPGMAALHQEQISVDIGR